MTGQITLRLRGTSVASASAESGCSFVSGVEHSGTGNHWNASAPDAGREPSWMRISRLSADHRIA